MNSHNFTSYFDYIYKPKKVENQLTNFLRYVIETSSGKKRAFPNVICVYRSSKVAARYNLDLTKEEIEKCKKRPNSIS